nr:transposase (putative), gypsy type [Tanacetum cinerariifolium]
FACPTLFSWHTTKNVTRDPAPVAADFNAQDYATLVAHLSPFQKFPEEFLCLVGLSRHYTLDEKTYPRFLHKNGEDMDLFAFIHTPDPIKIKVVKRDELERSIDKLFDKGGNGIQGGKGDSAGVGKGTNVQPVTEAADIVTEDLREDHGTLSGPSVPGKSRSAVQRLLVRAMLNAEVRGEPIPTLPFVTSSVSATPEPLTITTFTADPAVVIKEKTAKPSLFAADSSFVSEADPKDGVFSNLTKSCVCHEMVDEFAPSKFFASVQGMKHDQLFIEFNVGAARQMSLSAENELLKVKEKEIEDLKAQLLLKEAKAAKAIRLRAEASKFEAIKKSLQDKVKALKKRNASFEKERDALDVKVTGLEASAMGKDRELTDVNAQLTFTKSHNDNLVHELEVASSGLQEKLSSYENLTEWLEEFQDAQLKIVNDKLDKLCADFVEMAFHLEERFYPHLLTTISGHRWLLTHGMELAITKCLHSPKYLPALEAAIGKAIKKGMQDGLSAEISHGAEELRCNKDASVDTLMNILRLEETLAERLGLTESQPHVDQLMVPIHHLSDKVVVGAIALSLALDVSNIRVLTGMEGTSNTVPATSVTTMALSTTLASASIVSPIFVDDYEVAVMVTRRVRMGMRIPFLMLMMRN